MFCGKCACAARGCQCGSVGTLGLAITDVKDQRNKVLWKRIVAVQFLGEEQLRGKNPGARF
jgi:hypothetical protein